MEINAVLHRDQIRVLCGDQVLGMFLASDGFGVERLKVWMRTHPEFTITTCVGFSLHAKHKEA